MSREPETGLVLPLVLSTHDSRLTTHDSCATPFRVTEDKKGGIASFRVGFDDGSSAREVSTERGAFRIVVLSELSPQHDFATSARPSRDPKPIDKYTFDERLSELAGSLAIDVEDPFDSASTVRVDIRLSDLRSFRPDGLAEQASLLRAFLEARKALVAVRDGRSQLADVTRSLRRILPKEQWVDLLVGSAQQAAPAPAPAPAPPRSPGLDALLDQVDLQASQPAPPVSILGSLIRNDGNKPSASVAAAVTRIEQAFVTTMQRVLGHPEFRRLERSWRGLRLLVERTDQKSGVEIDAMIASRDEVLESLSAIVADASSGNSARGPVDLFVVDHEVTTDEPVLAALESWSEAAEILRAPIVANSTVALLGFRDIPAMQKSDRRIDSLDDKNAARLRGISSRERSRWLALALNAILVRPAYDASTARFREFPFEEAPEAHVFAGPAFVIAITAAASWVRHGFASEIVGPRHGSVENLPVRDVRAEGAHYAFPLEHLVSIDTQASVAGAGLILLGCAPNHDAAIVASAPTLYRGETTARGVDNDPLPLGDQLFVARVSHAIEQLAAAIPAGTPEDAIRDVTRVALTELFNTSRSAVPDLQVAIGKTAIEITVTPRRFAGVALGEFTLSAPLG